MFITKESDYAMRIIRELAGDKSPLPLELPSKLPAAGEGARGMDGGARGMDGGAGGMDGGASGRCGGERKTVQYICERELVPHQYGYKILKKLEKAGLVRSYRGTNGGYALAKETGDMTLYDVVTAVDGPLLLSECLDKNRHCPMNRGKKRCSVHTEFARIQALILAGLKEKTLKEIL
jgi:Rrf2 family protein